MKVASFHIFCFLCLASDIPKHFEVEPKDLQVSLGDYAAFECLINGQPPAKVTWYKKSNKLNTPLAKVFPTGDYYFSLLA